MFTPVSTLTRQATRKTKKLNILTFPTHERYETGLAQTGHNFYSYRAEGIKDWNTTYAPIPENYILLDGDKGSRQIPSWLDFDLVLSQNKFGQFQIAKQISHQLHLPLVSLEHTLPVPQWSQDQRTHLRSLSGHLNVFISSFSIDHWGFSFDPSVRVVHHMVDSEVFKPHKEPRKNHILSVVNDWVNRDWCCNYQGWQRITKDLPVQVVGDTQGLSVPASSTEELVKFYADSQLFLNTSVISPVPTAMLEAMACGCAVVSTATCMIPEIIKHGENGFISNDEAELRKYCELLLGDTDLARKMGEAARKTIVEKFSKTEFINKWNSVFEEAANLTYLG